MMKTVFKGKIAEQKVVLRAMEKGWLVSKPVCDARYDLILDDGTKLYKVQVKYADGKSSHSENCVVAQLRSRQGNKKDHRYTTDEIDVLIIYVPEIDKVIWINRERFIGKATLNIRLAPSKAGHINKLNIANELIW